MCILITPKTVFAEYDSDALQRYASYGEQYTLMHDFRSAIDCYTKAISINPRFWQGYNARGTLRMAIGEYQGAIDDFNASLNITKDYTTYYYRGLSKTFLNDRDGAEKDFTTSINITPNANAYEWRSVIRHDKKDYAGAIDDCTKALALDSGRVRLYSIRGSSKCRNGDLKGALKDYTNAINIAQNEEDYIERGAVRFDMKDYDGAMRDFAIAIKKNSRNYHSQFFKGMTLLRLEQYEEAIEVLSKSIKLNPNYPSSYYCRALAESSLERYDAALKDAERARDLYYSENDFKNYKSMIQYIESIKERMK